MALQRMLSGDPSRSSKLYLAIGVISLVKAIAVRNDSERFRRELVDAGLFLGVGLLLRQYSRIKAEKQAELESQLPDWLAGGSSAQSSGLRSMAKGRLGGESEPAPEPTLADRARDVIASR
ncbi:hypothetical protein ACFO5R_02305 [Halosolutus amylolyticus]|uniref:Uncharacterized protein n=1 Tax=Halosolutus amylolyticus TaxID=2932267 RepID=A0ABD5PK16_9EURY|nr:hypothetical protein [Halosolutus amylolyticus]